MRAVFDCCWKPVSSIRDFASEEQILEENFCTLFVASSISRPTQQSLAVANRVSIKVYTRSSTRSSVLTLHCQSPDLSSASSRRFRRAIARQLLALLWRYCTACHLITCQNTFVGPSTRTSALLD